MTVQKRPDNNIFASSAKSGELETFPDIPRGWGISFEQTEGKPPMEWFNYLFKRIDESIQYMLQQGLPEWSALEDYPIHAFTKVGNKVYRALSANKNKAPATNAIIWKEWGLDADSVLLKTNYLAEIKAAGVTAQKAARDNIGAIEENHSHSEYLQKKNNFKDLDDLTEAQANLQIYKQLPDLTANDNLNSLWELKNIGVRSCPNSAFATIENGYPLTKSGVLISTPLVGRVGQQIYIAHSGEMFQRNVSTVNPIKWSEWKQYASVSHLDEYVKNSRKINAKPLTTDITLTAADVGAATSSHGHAIANVTGLQTALDGKSSTSHEHADLVPKTRKINNKALSADVLLTATDLGAAQASHSHTIADVTGLQDQLNTKASTSHTHLELAKTDGSNINIQNFQSKLGLKDASLTPDGWQKLPSGLILQWGESSGGDAVVNFPIAFPNKCLFATGGQMTESNNSWYFVQITNSDRFTLRAQTYGGVVNGNVGVSTTVPFKWFALGY